jgi:hypothetical protein
MGLVRRETVSRDAETRRSALEAVYATSYWLLTRDRIAEAAAALRLMVRAEPGDERGWLGLGECHERIGQPRIAAELYGAGSVAASSIGSPSVRCLLARARVLRSIDRDEEADAALEAAASVAEKLNDDAVSALVSQERERDASES